MRGIKTLYIHKFGKEKKTLKPKVAVCVRFSLSRNFLSESQAKVCERVRKWVRMGSIVVGKPYTVKPLLSRHLWDLLKCPLMIEGVRFIEPWKNCAMFLNQHSTVVDCDISFMFLSKLMKLCCTLCKTLIVDENHTARYRSSLLFNNRNVLIYLKSDTVRILIEVFNDRN